MDGFSNEEWQRVTDIIPLGTAMKPNPFDTRGDEDPIARFGQRLFFDKRGAESILVDGPTGKGPVTTTDPVTGLPKTTPGEVGKISCATCHGSTYLVDARPFPISHGRSWLNHNTPTMANLGYMSSFLWTGRFDSMREHGTGALGGAATLMAQIHFIATYHLDEYNTLFPATPLDGAAIADTARFPLTGGVKGAVTTNGTTIMNPDGAFEKLAKADQWTVHQFRGNMGIVFEAHPRKLLTPGSKFEQYVRNEDSSALSEKAKNGLRLFIGKASCIDCHNGPALTDNQFHNVGVPNQSAFPPGVTSPKPALDRGRGGVLTAGLNNILMVLRTNEGMTDPMDQVAIMGGAGQYSDDATGGRKRIEDTDTAVCLQHSNDVAAVTTACQGLFFPGSPEDTTKTPVVAAKPADPRLQVCIERNMATAGVCVKYTDEFEGSFRTPMLLNIAETGPYFHTGEFATLRDVVNHYNQGGGLPGSFAGVKSPRLRPLGLTESEVDDLVEFLKSLTGVAPDPNWTCDLSLPPAAAGVAATFGGPCAATN